MEPSIAEKFEAAATLGLLSTRMRDYLDLWHLAKGFAFDGQAVSESIRATFERRAMAHVPKL
jgi:Nucleotidyl transferase AbiEii toxin, Type IV TA system